VGVLEPWLPKGMKVGPPPVWSRRQLIDGIRFRVRTGVPWRDVPVEYGPWGRIYDPSGAGAVQEREVSGGTGAASCRFMTVRPHGPGLLDASDGLGQGHQRDPLPAPDRGAVAGSA
jgi:transposase